MCVCSALFIKHPLIPSWWGCRLSQKHISGGFYRHFYGHTWKSPHKGHKLKYYDCYKSAQHPSALPDKSLVKYYKVLTCGSCTASSCFKPLSLLILTLSPQEVTETNFKSSLLYMHLLGSNSSADLLCACYKKTGLSTLLV